MNALPQFSPAPASASAQQAFEPRINCLLAAFAETALRRLQPMWQMVELRAGQVISENGGSSPAVIFPTTAIVSLLYMTRDGASTEVAVIGRDGMVGLGSVMGGNATPSRAVVQSGGQGLRLPAHALQSEMARGDGVLETVLRYAQALMAQVAQAAVCNRFHSIDQQLSRRLLTSLDLSPNDELALTHEVASSLLGVRREGVTSAAQKLRLAGAIRYRRGHVVVLDRARLAASSCECYEVTRKAYRTLLRVRLSLAA